MLRFLEGDAEQLPVESASQDSYSIVFGIRNVTHIDAALREAHRVCVLASATLSSLQQRPAQSDQGLREQVLRRGGHFLCLEFCPQPVQGLQTVYDWYSLNIIPQLGR